MLTFTGETTFPQPRPEVWARLTDMAFLTDCLPDLHSKGAVSESRAEAVLRPGFSFARGEMKLLAEKMETTPDESARYRLATKGIGAGSVVEATFRLADDGPGCRVDWSAEVKELTGLLKAVPRGLIQAGAQRVIGELLANAGKKLATDEHR